MAKWRKSASRKADPWGGAELTPTQRFISDNYRDDYESKHQLLATTNEAAFINSFTPSVCPYCGEESIIKRGTNSNNIQRYSCNKCGRRFIPTTGTIFDEHKIPIKDWIGYTLNIIRYVSVNAGSCNNRNAFETSRYWLQKLFLVLEEYPSTITIEGRSWLDETFYSLRAADIELNKDGTKPRGLSKNKMCIGVLCDARNILCIYEGEGKPTQKGTLEAFKDHIKPGSLLVHDEEQAHKRLIKELNLKSESYNSKDLKGIADSKNPLFRVNNVHARLKDFLNAHSSFDRNDLQNYLNLFSFVMNPPSDPLEKMEILLNLAFQNPKLLRYRDFYSGI